MIEILFFTIIGIVLQYKFSVLELILSLKLKTKIFEPTNMFKINNVPYEGKQLVLNNGSFYIDGIKQDMSDELNKTYDIKLEGKDACFYCLGNINSTSDINVSFLECNNISCKDINGQVNNNGDITTLGDINGNSNCDGNLSCKDINGDIQCEGNLVVQDVKGDINCYGNVKAHFINGSVTTENLEILK